MLVFVTTPASLINVLSTNNSFKYFVTMAWIGESTPLTKFLVKSLIPSLIVLGINELLLLLIQLLVEFQGKTRFSRHQRSVLRKTYVYYMFNMLLIPGLAANVINNAFDFIINGISDWNNFWKVLFTLENGNFFFTLLLNSAGGAFLSNMNAFYILVDNYMSPIISMFSKVSQRENEKWMKNNSMLLSWGSSYSMIVVISAIGFVFQYFLLYSVRRFRA